jgi:hypothetical protein
MAPLIHSLCLFIFPFFFQMLANALPDYLRSPFHTRSSPPHLLVPPPSSLLQAAERFEMEFAPLFDASARAAYNQCRLPPSALQLTDTVLGRGSFGTVWLGHLSHVGQGAASTAWSSRGDSARSRVAADGSTLVAVKTLTAAELYTLSGGSGFDARLQQLLLWRPACTPVFSIPTLSSCWAFRRPFALSCWRWSIAARATCFSCCERGGRAVRTLMRRSGVTWQARWRRGSSICTASSVCTAIWRPATCCYARRR